MVSRWFVVTATAACLGGANLGAGQPPSDEDDSSDPTPAPTGVSSSEDSNTIVIVLGWILGVLVAANIVICAMYRAGRIGAKRKSEPCPVQPAPPEQSAPYSDPNAATELALTKQELATERERRQYFEALINRDQRGHERLDAFPKPKQVAMHVEQAGDLVLMWTERAVRGVDGRPALPLVIKNVLMQTLLVCQGKVQMCLDKRLHHFQEFIGSGEKIAMSDAGAMRLDTKYVMNEILTSNYKQIVPVGDKNYVATVVGAILEHARREGNARGGQLAEEMITSGDLQSPFESVVKKYLTTFAECALQNPPITFSMDDLGKVMVFDAEVHRELAAFPQVSSKRCCIVFPAMQTHKGLPQPATRAGVIRVFD